MEEVFDVDGVEVEAVDVVVNESSRCSSKIERRRGWLVIVDDGCCYDSDMSSAVNFIFLSYL